MLSLLWPYGSMPIGLVPDTSQDAGGIQQQFPSSLFFRWRFMQALEGFSFGFGFFSLPFPFFFSLNQAIIFSFNISEGNLPSIYTKPHLRAAQGTVTTVYLIAITPQMDPRGEEK